MIRAFCVVLVVPMMRNSELVYGGSCSLIWSFALTILDEILRLYKGVCKYVSLDLFLFKVFFSPNTFITNDANDE